MSGEGRSASKAKSICTAAFYSQKEAKEKKRNKKR
jgi:hypothetical protein